MTPVARRCIFTDGPADGSPKMDLQWLIWVSMSETEGPPQWVWDMALLVAPFVADPANCKRHIESNVYSYCSSNCWNKVSLYRLNLVSAQTWQSRPYWVPPDDMGAAAAVPPWEPAHTPRLSSRVTLHSVKDIEITCYNHG